MKETLILNLIYFVVSYIIMFLIYALIISRRRRDYKEGKKQAEISYIINKFNLDMRVVKYKTLNRILTFVNPLIISIIFLVVVNIKSFTLALIIGFIITIILTCSTYEIIGRILKRKGEIKHV